MMMKTGKIPGMMLMALNKTGILLIVFISLLPLSYLGADETFEFSSDRSYAKVAKGQERTVLTGNAVIITETTEIRADEIELFGEDSRYASCTGNIVVKNKEQGIILTCQNLLYDRVEEVSRVQGYVEMQDQKNEVVVVGNYLEDYAEEELTMIQVSVRIIKVSDGDEMISRSEFAMYRRSEDMLELSGLPEVQWKGDYYSADRILINLENDEITLIGDVAGTVTNESDNSSESDRQEPETDAVIEGESD